MAVKKKKNINRPFDPKILARAEKIAAQYEIIVWYEDGEYYGKGLEMPLVFGDGKTIEKCYHNVREALTTCVASLIEDGEPIPSPANEGKRNEQVNIRLTAEEKTILTAAAKSQGFRTLADYVRSRALTI